MSNSYPQVVLPHLTWLDTNNQDPQMIMPRAGNIASLHIDSRLGYNEFDPSNDIIVASNIGVAGRGANPLFREDVRRVAPKHFELFYYLDNIIEGYNDQIEMVLEQRAPDPPRTEIINITLDPGVYDLQALADEIKEKLDAWFVANWAPPPIPVSTVAIVAAPAGSNLLGSLNITVDTFSLADPYLAINPASSFIANSSSMLVLSASNTWPVPSVQFVRINFFSLSAYNYIDMVSYTLTRDSKNLSSTNTSSNYTLFMRIYSPQYGFNKYDFTEPLLWTNVNWDSSIFSIDFKFVDSNGKLIKTAVRRNFWWLLDLKSMT